MLRKLTVENFSSIRAAQTLGLEIAKNATDPDERFACPIQGSSERFPKVVVLFGANASGKTNVLKAISFLLEFVKYSIDWRPDLPMPFFPFSKRESETTNTKFFVEFDAKIFPDQKQREIYRYELELSAEKNSVIVESLKHFPKGKAKRLFERGGNNIRFSKEFFVSERDPVKKKVRSNASVVSTLARFNHEYALALYQNMEGVLSNVSTFGKRETAEKVATRYYIENREIFSKLNEEIKRLDLGIKGVTINSTVDGVRPFFDHAGLDGLMSFDLESDGTKAFYNLFPYLYFALAIGGLVVLDELDATIHPLVLPEIVRIFQDKETNPYDGQLIMSCHNATLLDYLEKEEIFFTEKDDSGATCIYGLSELKGIRRDTNIYANYLAGSFGSVPRLG